MGDLLSSQGGGGGGGLTGTPGSIVFLDGSGVEAEDNANLFWDASAKFIGVGTPTPILALDVRASTASDGLINLANSNVAGYSSINFNNNTPVFEGSLGYGNASVAIAHLQGKLFFYSGSVNWIFANSARAVATIGMTDGQTFLELADGHSGGSTSSASTGRLSYDNTNHWWRCSSNGSAADEIARIGPTSFSVALRTGAIAFGDSDGRLAYNVSGNTGNDEAFIYNSDHLLLIGRDAAVGTQRLQVTTKSSGEGIKITARDTTSYADVTFFDSANGEHGGVGWAAGSVGTTLANLNFLYTPGGGSDDWVISDSVTNWFRFHCTTGSVGLSLTDGASAAVGASGTCKFKYDNGTKTLKLSLDGAAYVTVVTI